MSKSAKKRASAPKTPAGAGRKAARAGALIQPKAAEGRSGLKAISRHRDAAIAHRATIAAMMKATGWQQHSVRGFLAGVVRKRLKLKLGSKKVDGTRVYQIASGTAGKAAARQPSARSS